MSRKFDVVTLTGDEYAPSPEGAQGSGGVDGDTRPNGSRRATPRKADSRFDSGPLPCFTAKRPVSAQRDHTGPTHADAPVPQQIAAIGDDGTHHPLNDRPQARKGCALGRIAGRA